MSIKQIKFDIDSVLTQHNQEKLQNFYDVLKSENEKLNLVSRETIETGLPQLAAESLLPLEFLKIKQFDSYLDIGSGGGIPSFPILISEQVKRATLVERIGKKAKSLERMAESMEISKLNIFNQTIEDIKFEKKFDLISMRLVKLTDKLLKKITQNLSKDGIFLYYYKPEISMEKFSCSSVTYSYSTGLKTPDKFFSVITKNI
ncbi:MAG: hypothetical protein DWP97_03375 [Calditrichaeota bacterium]|nr:MAG: hypothetical protein DWP97_03375 [Calditrichota bacterium]